MRAIIANKPGGPEVLELVHIEPPTARDGEVELRVRAFGLNKAESYYRTGNYGTFVPGQALGPSAVNGVQSRTRGTSRPTRAKRRAQGRGEGALIGRHIDTGGRSGNNDDQHP